tara:strand:+ start:354 stop:566 length:213 start_codon:yes stop_codon:yes gene_type:complete
MEEKIDDILVAYEKNCISYSEMKKQLLNLHGVSHQRELLKAYSVFLKSDESKYYSEDFGMDEFLEAFNCG